MRNIESSDDGTTPPGIVDALITGDIDALKAAGGNFIGNALSKEDVKHDAELRARLKKGGAPASLEDGIQKMQNVWGRLDAAREKAGLSEEFSPADDEEYSMSFEYLIDAARKKVAEKPKDADFRNVLKVYERCLQLGYKTTQDFFKDLKDGNADQQLLCDIIFAGNEHFAVAPAIFKAAVRNLKKDKNA